MKKLFGGHQKPPPPPPPKGCWQPASVCYGKSGSSKLFDIVSDILKTPGQRMRPQWDIGGVFGSGPCGEYCLSAGEVIKEIGETIYSPDKRGWHEYVVKNLVCAAVLACSREEMIDQLLRFAIPGQDPAVRVQDQHIYKVHDPRTLIDLPRGYRWAAYVGKVVTFISDDGMTIKNITRPGHIFDGKITRTLSIEDGAWYVTTHGIGNNVVPFMDRANEWQGQEIFNYVDAQMRANIEAHH